MPDGMDEAPFLSHVFIASDDLAATRSPGVGRCRPSARPDGKFS